MKFLLFHFISIYFIFTIYRETELVCFKTPAERYWMKWQEFDTTGLENVYTQYTSNYNAMSTFREKGIIIWELRSDQNGRGLSYPIKPEIKIFTDQVLRVRQDSARETNIKTRVNLNMLLTASFIKIHKWTIINSFLHVRVIFR